MTWLACQQGPSTFWHCLHISSSWLFFFDLSANGNERRDRCMWSLFSAICGHYFLSTDPLLQHILSVGLPIISITRGNVVAVYKYLVHPSFRMGIAFFFFLWIQHSSLASYVCTGGTTVGLRSPFPSVLKLHRARHSWLCCGAETLLCVFVCVCVCLLLWMGMGMTLNEFCRLCLSVCRLHAFNPTQPNPTPFHPIPSHPIPSHPKRSSDVIIHVHSKSVGTSYKK